jgi:Flp pilus assembly protein TadG
MLYRIFSNITSQMRISLDRVLPRPVAGRISGMKLNKEKKALAEMPNSDRGQTLVEFALFLPLLLILLFGIIEFGIIIYDQVAITNGIREGARVGSLYRANGAWTEPDIQTVVDNYLKPRLITFGTPFDKSTVHATWSGTPPSAGGTDGQVTVSVLFPYRFLVLPNLQAVGSATFNLGSKATMRTE